VNLTDATPATAAIADILLRLKMEGVDQDTSEDIVRQRAGWESQSLLVKSGLSPLNMRQSFSNFSPILSGEDNTEPLDRCQRFAEDFRPGDGRGLLLHGAPGTGKGHLCSSILQTVMKRGIRARVWKVPDLLARFRSLYQNDVGIVDFVKETLVIPLIWLDELTLDAVGSDYEAKRAFEPLYMIVDGAVETGVGLLVTTNYSPSELAKELKRIDPSNRLLDRLRGSLDPIHVKGESVRQLVRTMKHVYSNVEEGRG